MDNQESQDPHMVDRRVAVRRKEDYFWLKRLADLTGEACIVVNRSMRIEFADDKISELLQISPQELAELSQFSQLTRVLAERGYFGSGDPETFEALISDLLVNQRLKQSTTTQIIKAVTPSGQHIDIRVSLGRDDSYLLLMRDCTDEEVKQRALDTALEVGKSGYWFYNLETREFKVRADSFEEFCSPETFEYIKRNGFDTVIHEDDLPLSRSMLKDVVEQRKSGTVNLRLKGDDGSVQHVRSHVMPNIDESGKVRTLCCFFTNITSQVESENALKAARLETEKTLSVKNEFLGRMSHEVRTPLNAVIGMADALVHNCKNPEILPQLQLIQNSAENVMELVDSTLEHTKLAEDAVELNTRECSPAELVKSVTRKWETRAQSGGTALTCRIHKDVPELFVFDDYRYEQCLSNLLSNALKFTKGGKVEVLMAPSGKNDKRQLLLAVRDNGIGIAKTALSEVFLPFKQADKSITSQYGGTGLGLAIVKDIVELMDGRISVNSELGKGTVFAITIPMPTESSQTDALFNSVPEEPVPAPAAQKVEPAIAQPEAPKANLVDDLLNRETHAAPMPAQTTPAQKTQAPETAPQASEKSPHGDLRVLIVDDNATNHIVVSSLLAKTVGSIDTALNGEEAISKLKDKAFDLVLMDIHMPVMDGIETTLAIRSEPTDYQDVPIIALTADPQYQQARLCRNIGMNSSLGKPIKLAALIRAFDEVLLEGGGETTNVATAA